MNRVDERNPTLPPIAALWDYWEAAIQPSTRPSPVVAESAAVTRLLSNIERATARITLGPPSNGVGPMYEAVARLRVFDARGMLPRLSAHSVAQNLQAVLFTGHPRALKYAARGWLTLDLCDRFDLIQVWLSTPDPDDPRGFRSMRLRERMDEIRNDTECPQLTSMWQRVAAR